MTVEEIHKEVYEDLRNLITKIKLWQVDFKKIVLRTKRYPVTKSYTYQTREKKNLFTVNYLATKRSEWKSPFLNIYGIYTRPEGRYAVSPDIDTKTVTIYPPHFFKRYRERIVKDDSISNMDLMMLYFKHDVGYMAEVLNEELKGNYQHFESDHTNEKVSFIAVCSEGYCFGEKRGDTKIIKTIISYDMLFENQKLIFTELQEKLRQTYKNRHGVVI